MGVRLIPGIQRQSRLVLRVLATLSPVHYSRFLNDCIESLPVIVAKNQPEAAFRRLRSFTNSSIGDSSPTDRESILNFHTDADSKRLPVDQPENPVHIP